MSYLHKIQNLVVGQNFDEKERDTFIRLHRPTDCSNELVGRLKLRFRISMKNQDYILKFDLFLEKFLCNEGFVVRFLVLHRPNR